MPWGGVGQGEPWEYQDGVRLRLQALGLSLLFPVPPGRRNESVRAVGGELERGGEGVVRWTAGHAAKRPTHPGKCPSA